MSSKSHQSKIKDVAKRAGCSIATVSRVLNQTAPTSPAIQAKVKAAAAELGFRFNALGQNLRTQRSRTLGVLVPSLMNPVFASSVAGIQTVARAEGYQLLITATDYSATQELEAVQTLLAQHTEGLLLTVADAEASAALALLDAEKIPYVLLYNQPSNPNRSAVTVDNVAATQALGEQLLAMGHQRIGFVAGHFQASDRSRLRYQGLSAALAHAELEPALLLEVDHTVIDHTPLLTRLFQTQPLPTALCCSNDLLALIVISTLRRNGLEVPADISVTGFDGISWGQLFTPSLATIEQPAYMMGIKALQQLLEQIRQPQQAPQVLYLPYAFRAGTSLAWVSQK